MFASGTLRFFFNLTATTEIYTLPYTTLFRSQLEAERVDGADGDLAETIAKLQPAASIEHGLLRRLPQLANDSLAHLRGDRKSTRLNSSHSQISYAVFCLKKKTRKWSRSERAC